MISIRDRVKTRIELLAYDKEMISRLSKATLKVICKDFGLYVSGSREKLIERILEAPKNAELKFLKMYFGIIRRCETDKKVKEPIILTIGNCFLYEK